MRKIFTLLAGLALAHCAKAQTVSNFESLVLSKSDTFYVNYGLPNKDVGFNSGLAHFPCVYDTAFGGFWVSGFAYSNMKDSITSGYMNQYAAKTAAGYNNTAKYAVAYGQTNTVHLRGAALGKPVKGVYLTNSTYAYNSMRDGDFFAKKFGGVSGTDTDWFKLTIKGYLKDTLGKDSVDFYLADFRNADNAKDSILKYWKWADLQSLGPVDSLQFSLSSSDNGAFGMNTPAYFCMDDFTTYETFTGVAEVKAMPVAKVYPNPAVNELFVDAKDNSVKAVAVYDMSGRLVIKQDVKDAVTSVNIATLLPGVYILELTGEEQNASLRFVKQ